MDLIPLESNLHKFHLVIISQIINMIESDNFWHRKTFESVMSDLWNMWTEGIQELKIHACIVQTMMKTTMKWME